MPANILAAVIAILLIIGIISLLDSVLRLYIRTSADTDTLVVLAISSPENTEQALRYAIKKHPAAKLIVKSFTAEDDEKILEIIKKKYPEVIVENEKS